MRDPSLKGYLDFKVSKVIKSTRLLGAPLAVCESTFYHRLKDRWSKAQACEIPDRLTFGESDQSRNHCSICMAVRTNITYFEVTSTHIVNGENAVASLLGSDRPRIQIFCENSLSFFIWTPNSIKMKYVFILLFFKSYYWKLWM